MKALILFLVALTAAFSVQSQTQVSGRVFDAVDGAPLVGVTILERGTTNGTSTNVDGAYTLRLSAPDAVLVASYTGYTSLEIPVNGREQLDITMGESENLLEQVVVVGYGTQRKSDLTGSVGTVSTQAIERVPTASLEQALQGKIAGVHVTPSNGEPGQGAVIRIRGTGTLNNSNPIYVVDGMITYDASFVNPQDVQSVEVLKDASAAAIYGSRGANGVIIITTKNGRQRGTADAVISLNTYYGTQSVTNKIDLVNASQFAQLYNELEEVPDNYYPNPEAFGEGTDWQDEIFRTAPIASVQLGINGGSDRFSYNVSGNYFNQSGIIKNSEFERYTARFNSQTQVNKWFTLGNNLTYAYSKKQLPPGVVLSALRMPPLLPPRDSTGNFSDPTSPFGLPLSNPAAELFYRSDKFEKGDRFFGTVFGDIKLFKYFTFRSNLGFDIYNRRETFYIPKYRVSPSQVNLSDSYTVTDQRNRDWIWEQTLTFNREWENHRLNVLAGYTAEERTYERFGASRRDFPGASVNILYLDAGNDTTQTNFQSANEVAIVSYLFRTNYTLFNRYLFTASLRIDEASRFAEDNRTAAFPSFSLGWNVDQEGFMERVTWIDRLKIRGSYGWLGNQNSARNYPSYGRIETGQYAIFGPGESLNQGATITEAANPGLQWETTRQTDIALEIGLLNNRLTAEIDWYNRLTYDIIAPVPIPLYVGVGGAPLVNAGRLRNRGMDITLNWRQAGDFSWNVGVVASPVQNELLFINGQTTEIFGKNIQGDFATRTTVGQPVGSFYGLKVAGIFNTDDDLKNLPKLGAQKVGELRFQDLNADGVIDNQDRTSLGSPIPTFTYGLNAGFDWKGIDFAIDFVGVTGNKVLNAKKMARFGVYNWEQSYFDNRWTEANPNGTAPRITNGGANYRMSDYYVEDGSYFRLRTVVLGYSLPRNLLERARINRLRVYVSGFNLWTMQKYTGYSPEFANRDNVFEVGIDEGAFPVAKSFQFGLDLTF